MTIEAVIFDIGNVLIEWQPERFYDTQIGEDRRKALFAAVDLHAMNERVDLGENFHEVIAEQAALLPQWHTEIMMWHDRWLDMATPAIDRSVRLMAALQTRGVPVFSLTNFGVETYQIAETRYPFLKQFDRDFISGHMRCTKPGAEIYAKLEKASGLSAKQLIFTDDRPENIAAAKARGWHTHLFEGAEGWAARLVAEKLLSEEEAR